MANTIEEMARELEDEKIDARATEFAEREYEVGEIDRDALRKGYYWGAKDTMSLPLADRLTDSEREKIRAFYNGDTFGELDFIELISCRRVLESIFGKEIFGKEVSDADNS